MTPKVLVVDDFEPIRNLYVDVLKRCHVDVIEATNGADALSLIHTEKPDIIILDEEMPRISGLEVLQRIRRNPDTKDIPVMIVTANHMIEQSDAVAEADLTLVKPVSLIDLANFVRRLLSASNSA